MAKHLTSPTNRAAPRPVGSVVDIPLLDGATNAGRTNAGRTGAGRIATGLTGAGMIDVAVLRHRPLPIAPWVIAAVMDLVAAALILRRPVHGAVMVAGGLHLAAVLPILFWRSLANSERMLGSAFALSIPVAGPPL